VSFYETDRVLIIGANSLISRALVQRIKPYTSKITLVSRLPIEDIDSESEDYIALNLEDIDSVSNLFQNLQESHFDYVYILAGAASKLDISSSSLEETQDYYRTYGASLNYLIGRIQTHLSDSATMIFVSSRAAHRPSYDAHYSAIKASTEAFIMSIANRFPGRRLLVLAPSLIEETKMFNDMLQENIKLHRERTFNSLLTIEEVVESILEISFERDKFLSGSTTYIGRDW